MDWASLTPAIFSLVGVAIGTLGSLTVGYFTTRTTREQARMQRDAALRSERKDAILEYLSIVQDCQNHLVLCTVESAEPPPGWDQKREWSRLDDRLWFHCKKLLLMAQREPLRIAATALAEAVDSAMKNKVPEGIHWWDYVDPFEERFLDSAREDLGIPGIPTADARHTSS
jgi:hypothetical protein